MHFVFLLKSIRCKGALDFKHIVSSYKFINFSTSILVCSCLHPSHSLTKQEYFRGTIDTSTVIYYLHTRILNEYSCIRLVLWCNAWYSYCSFVCSKCIGFSDPELRHTFSRPLSLCRGSRWAKHNCFDHLSHVHWWRLSKHLVRRRCNHFALISHFTLQPLRPAFHSTLWPFPLILMLIFLYGICSILSNLCCNFTLYCQYKLYKCMTLF